MGNGGAGWTNNVARPVARTVAKPFLEGEILALVEPRIENPSMHKRLTIAAMLSVRLVYIVWPEAVRFSCEVKVDRPVLNALTKTGPGKRIKIDERQLDCVCPFVFRVP
jgi:hypothetical protein